MTFSGDFLSQAGQLGRKRLMDEYAGDPPSKMHDDDDSDLMACMDG